MSGDEAVVLFCLPIRWQGKVIKVEGVSWIDTVFSLKMRLYQLTRVPVEKQKLLGLIKGKIPANNIPLSEILQRTSLSSISIMLLGSAESATSASTVDTAVNEGSASDGESSIDSSGDEDDSADDEDGPGDVEVKDVQVIADRLKLEYRPELDRYADKLDIQFITNLRPGKKLLVLDLDYTLYDPRRRCMRPFMHDFLKSAYQNFDIAIWSQTPRSKLEAKITEIGLLTYPFYRISFVMDIASMLSVRRQRSDGTVKQHQIKALDLIWRKLPNYGPHNTLHVDDLRRNFCMNPANGIKIDSYHADRPSSRDDNCLIWLGGYLGHLATLTDVRSIDHEKWTFHVKRYLKQNGNALNPRKKHRS